MDRLIFLLLQCRESRLSARGIFRVVGVFRGIGGYNRSAYHRSRQLEHRVERFPRALYLVFAFRPGLALPTVEQGPINGERHMLCHMLKQGNLLAREEVLRTSTNMQDPKKAL